MALSFFTGFLSMGRWLHPYSFTEKCKKGTAIITCTASSFFLHATTDRFPLKIMETNGTGQSSEVGRGFAAYC
jgi:hypothetical protein